MKCSTSGSRAPTRVWSTLRSFLGEPEDRAEEDGEEGEAGPCLRLGGAEPVTARESAAGAWTVRSLRAEVGMSLPEGCRVVSPARLETELGLATLEQRVLSFIGAAGSVRRTILDLDAEATAPCQGAPWLALLEGQSVSLRELGARWGRRLGSWSLPAT